MTTQTEALKLALDFISRLKFADAEPEPERVMATIKKALDRVDPAPVAKNEGGRITWLIDDWPQNCFLYSEPPSWTPVEIGVDVTSKGTHVVGMYVLPDAVRYVFYSQLHPAPQRTWVGLTEEERKEALVSVDAETKRLPPGFRAFAEAIEDKLKEQNT